MAITSISLGCEAQRSPTPGGVAPPAKSKVIAQGQILPAGGVIQLSAPPGDVVEKVLVEVGDDVKRGDPLLEMRSEKVSAAQLETLRKRREEAVRQRDNALAAAERQVRAAAMKLEHLDAQQASLARKQDLLDFAKKQVAASEDVLKKLESIRRDEMTSEFVGQLELDRQRIKLDEAELSYRQQAEVQKQAQEDLEWARRAAAEEKSAAEEALELARASGAIEVLDLEINALEKQASAARIVAPSDGVVLAVNAAVGEASLQLPMIEMANINHLVCEIEINEMDAGGVEVGQPAKITSRALGGKELHGTVAKKFMLVGRPQLRAMDPLARADYRTVTALIELDEESAQAARQWLQLQVEVEIDKE